MSLENIVVVNIDRQTKFPTKKGFGTPMIMDINVKQTNEVDTLTDIESLEAIGFVAADEAHKAFSRILAQNPHPPETKLGKRAANVAQVDRVNFGGSDDGTYTISLNGTDFSFVASSNTITEIRDALIIAINLGAEPVDAVLGVDLITLTADNAGEGFSTVLTANPNTNMVLTLVTPNVGMSSEITRLNGIDSDWYFLLSTSRLEQDILQSSATIETLVKTFFYETDQADSKDLAFAGDVTSIMGQLKVLSRMRTAGTWTKTLNLDNYPSPAWVGKNAPEEAGSITWMFKQASGLLPDDELTPTELTNIQGKNGNVYHTVAGVGIFEEGKMADEEFIDLVRGTDQLSRRIQENVFALLISEGKVPMTDKGTKLVDNAIRDAMQEAEDNGFLASEPKFTITVPLIENVSVADRVARFLKGITFDAKLAGAVHKTDLKGTLTV